MMGSISEKSINQPWRVTPLVESSTLSQAAGCRIFLKLENLQPATSFKSRGMGNLIRSQVEHHKVTGSTKPLHFYSSSGGNAGLAAVSAARSLGYKASVIVPKSTEEWMIAKIKSAGATDVIQHGKSWQDADDYLRQVVIPSAGKEGDECIYVPPFDHPAIWDGVGTMIEEIRTQIPDGDRPDAIICSVGGGGLFCGVMEGLRQVGWDDTKVLAVETDGADSLAKSLKEGQLVTLDGITSVAKSLGAVRVAQRALENAQQKNVRSIVLDDAEACMGCWRFADDERILVEPACGASVALCYDARLERFLEGFTPNSKVVVIVCGGSRITLDMMREYQEQFAEKAAKLEIMTSKAGVPSTYT